MPTIYVPNPNKVDSYSKNEIEIKPMSIHSPFWNVVNRSYAVSIRLMKCVKTSKRPSTRRFRIRWMHWRKIVSVLLRWLTNKLKMIIWPKPIIFGPLEKVLRCYSIFQHSVRFYHARFLKYEIFSLESYQSFCGINNIIDTYYFWGSLKVLKT